MIAVTRSASQRFGPFRFDTANRLLLRESDEIPLPPRVIALLECLLERPGQVITRQELIERVWRDSFVTDTSLAEAISALRQALGDDPQRPSYVQTLHRRGYRFVAEVIADPPPAEPLPPDAAAPAASRPDSPTILQLTPWALVLILAATLAVALWKLTHPPEPRSPQPVTFDLSLPAGTALDWSASPLAVSPDGRAIAFVACDAGGACLLYLRELAARTARPLEGSTGAAAPFFSPDGAWIGFFASGKLKKMPAAGGTPATLCDAPDPLGAAWLPGGRIVFAGHDGWGLEAVSDSGGTPAPFTSVEVEGGELGHRWPYWLPGSEHVIFTVTTVPGDAGAMRVAAVSPPVRRHTTLTARAAGGRLIAPDLVVFARGDELFAARFDRQRGLLASTPVRVGGRVVSSSDGAPALAASAHGLLLNAQRRHAAAGLAVQRPDGSRLTPGAPLDAMIDARLSPAGDRVAGVVSDGQRRDIWIGELTRETASRLTHEGLAASPVWTGDGRAIVFAGSVAGGPFNLWWAGADAPGARRLLDSPAHQFPTAAVGRRIVYTQHDAATKGDIWSATIDASGRAVAAPLVRTPFDERGGAVSADGRWLAYESDESGDWQIYLRPVSGGRRVVVGPSPSRDARWIGAGLLGYRSAGRLYQVAVSGAGEIGAPKRMADLRGWRFADVGAGPTLLLQRPAAADVHEVVVALEAGDAIARAVPPPLSAMPR